LLMRTPPHIFTRFPYTTLFRSPMLLESIPLAKMVSSSRGSRASTTAARRASDRRCFFFKCGLLHPVRTKGPPGSVLATRFYPIRSEEHTSELQSCGHLVCRLLL